MRGFFSLPASLLVLLYTAGCSGEATPAFHTRESPWNDTINSAPGPTRTSLASEGSGPEYVSACASATYSYSSAYTSYSLAHRTVSNYTQLLGGTSWSVATYYEGASTLCDGHPRVPSSSAIPLATVTSILPHAPTSSSIIQQTNFYAYPGPSPSCSIRPSDCDPLWAAYSTSMNKWRAATAQTTPAPQTPPCWNQSFASSWASETASIYGCGLCTIFGERVELVYFPEPTTVSRDMCASTPLASQTYYEPGHVYEAYAGTQYGRNVSTAGKETAIVGQNTFTSGTAYISIATVYAEDRCSSTRGTPVYNAILAMPSESVLSLRYSQDHFKWAQVTGTQTGYPVSYADFNTPIPWSAWNGQAQCIDATGGYQCSVITEDSYRPQLAIPPEINQLNPDWSDCQLWYGGLYDPPLALQPAQSIAKPTVPVPYDQATSPAAPSSAVAAPTVTATALPEQYETSDSSTQQPETPQGTSAQTEETGGIGADGTRPYGGAGSFETPQETSGQTEATGGSWGDSTRANGGAGSWTHAFVGNGRTWSASACGGNACVDGNTISPGEAAQTLPDGLVASYGSGGLAVHGSSTIQLAQQTEGNEIAGPTLHPGGIVQTVITIATQTMTVRQGQDGAVDLGSTTLVPGGPATTLEDGQVLSAADEGLVMGWSSSVRVDAEATSPADGTEPTQSYDASATISDGAASAANAMDGSASGAGTTGGAGSEAGATNDIASGSGTTDGESVDGHTAPSPENSSASNVAAAVMSGLDATARSGSGVASASNTRTESSNTQPDVYPTASGSHSVSQTSAGQTDAAQAADISAAVGARSLDVYCIGLLVTIVMIVIL